MNKKYIAVIQAGGKGTRMVELTEDKIPKPMLILNGKPMIQWQIENLIEYGITEICIIIGHLGNKIEEYFGDGQFLGAHISYIKEDEPLGSAGSLYYVRYLADNRDILLVFGDVMIKLDWNRMISFHEHKNATATLLVHPNAHPYDSDLILLNESLQVVGIDSKNNNRDYWYDNIVNAGIYILENHLLETFTEPCKTDLEKDILLPLMNDGCVYGYRTPEYVKDAGTPDRFANCKDEQARGIWNARCLNNKQRAVFIDRDGTINKYNGLIYLDSQFELEDCACEAVKLLNSAGYLAICVTNQPVVARGMCEIDDVLYIHKKMQTLLGQEGAYLDDIAFCPHHPDKGYPEENPIYKIKCQCRKPNTGMIDGMIEKYNISIEDSWVIGDSTIDMKLGYDAGAKTILVETGQAGNDKKYEVKPDFEAENLLEAVKLIVSEGR